jgi:hypothetical protein
MPTVLASAYNFLESIPSRGYYLLLHNVTPNRDLPVLGVSIFCEHLVGRLIKCWIHLTQ